jgi:hypothetical protein
MPAALLLALALVAASPPPGYVRVVKEQGVTVYRREGTPLIDILAEGVIPAPPERVREVLLDYPRHPEFLQRIPEVRVLTRAPGSMLVYQRIDLPVLADRDMVLRVTWGEEPAGVLFTHFASVGAGAPVPPRRGLVRVTTHEGGWRLQPVRVDGRPATLARYQMHIDLGGSLPGWMARSQAGKDVPALFVAISARAARNP